MGGGNLIFSSFHFFFMLSIRRFRGSTGNGLRRSNTAANP